MAVGTASKVGIERSGVDLVAELVERLGSGPVTDRSEVGSLEVGLTVVNI